MPTPIANTNDLGRAGRQGQHFENLACVLCCTSCNPLANAENRQNDEDPPLEEDSGESILIRDGTRSVVANDGIREEGIKPQTWREADGKVGHCR